jgi:hypothetical protein
VHVNVAERVTAPQPRASRCLRLERLVARGCRRVHFVSPDISGLAVVSLETSTFLFQAVVLIIAFGIPARLFLYLRRRFPPVPSLVHGLATVFVTWPLLIAFRCAALPLFVAHMENLNTDPERIGTFDGVGGNIVVLLFGWLPPLMSVIAVSIVIWISRLFRNRLLTGCNDGMR